MWRCVMRRLGPGLKVVRGALVGRMIGVAVGVRGSGTVVGDCMVGRGGVSSALLVMGIGKVVGPCVDGSSVCVSVGSRGWCPSGQR